MLRSQTSTAVGEGRIGDVVENDLLKLELKALRYLWHITVMAYNSYGLY